MRGQSDFYRVRWEGYLPRTIKALLRLSGAEGILRSRFMDGFLQTVERIAPPDKKILQDIGLRKPDAVIVRGRDFSYRARLAFGVE